MSIKPDDLIKTEEQINIMRKGGLILGNILKELDTLVKPGIQVMTLEDKFITLCEKNNVIPECKGYSDYGFPPFPTGLCVSINSQSVHCFPRNGVILKDGDVITVDTVIRFNEMCVDSSFAKVVGDGSLAANNLVNTSKKALYDCIGLIKDGTHIGNIGERMHKIAKANGFDVLRDYAGHGIGIDMHSWPDISCYGNRNDGPKLKEGMTICIESLLCSGKPDVIELDGWETEMADGGLFAQFEHTILVTKNGYEVLTIRPE